MRADRYKRIDSMVEAFGYVIMAFALAALAFVIIIAVALTANGQQAPVMPCSATPYVPFGMIYQPTVWATYQAGQVSFTCTNLNALPVFSNTACPGPITVTGLTLGQTVYFGLTWSGILHVGTPALGYAVSQAAICSGCFQDATQMPQPGEFPIGIYTAGASPPITPQWTGAPALPVVTIIQPAAGAALITGCVAAQTPTAVQVTCQ
jgi:hypothetical protein